MSFIIFFITCNIKKNIFKRINLRLNKEIWIKDNKYFKFLLNFLTSLKIIFFLVLPLLLLEIELIINFKNLLFISVAVSVNLKFIINFREEYFLLFRIVFLCLLFSIFCFDLKFMINFQRVYFVVIIFIIMTVAKFAIN